MYQQLIIESTNRPEDALEIEAVMRHDIFHSTLDWQDRETLVCGALEAAELLDIFRKELPGYVYR